MADDSSDQVEPSAPNRLTIAGIGASAGGVQALQDFFSGLPEQVGAAMVVVVHLDPTHQSDLAGIIATKTRIPVQQVEDSAALAPDRIYVIPPNRELKITDTEVTASEFSEPRGQRAPIDSFFRSLAQHGDGFAIILSGAGSDGALGVRAVKEAGGLILVQDPNEAEYASMPRAAIAAGHADFVLPARELARQFAELVRGREELRQKTTEDETDELLGRILAYLRIQTGHDFAQYKCASLLRRLDRRVQVTKSQDLREYLDFLRERPEEVHALFADLLISVTRFFRDPQAFEQLERIVVPAILDRKATDETIRIWVPGCATGEEAYSLAIIFLDQLARRQNRPEIQIFATDLDPRALTVARDGRYPETLSIDVSGERLRRYFTREGDEYRIKREVRDLLVFAQHSVVKNPPFSRLDLISCRNFLIYIDRDLQRQVIGMFHYALVPSGYLFLGSSETAEQPEGLFKTIDRTARIFQSTGPQIVGAFPLPKGSSNIRLAGILPTANATEHQKTYQQHRQALIELGPPSILVDENHRIRHLSAKAGNYLLHPQGAPTLDIIDLVRPELASEMRDLLNRAFQLGETGMSLPVSVQFNGAARNVCLQVSLAGDHGQQPRALILFIEGGPAQMTFEKTSRPDENSSETVKRLEEELVATRANLKMSRQQFEAATENLRAANEELQSINEEYRSTAEELETSREELQSMNEELQTLNAELNAKLDTASRANSDLENRMDATNVGTLFLDAELRITRFTPGMQDLFNINLSDEGREIADFTNLMDYPDFERDMNSVKRNKAVINKTVQAGNRSYLMQMRPYRTAEGTIEGLVVTFVDTTAPNPGRTKPKKPVKNKRKSPPPFKD